LFRDKVVYAPFSVNKSREGDGTFEIVSYPPLCQSSCVQDACCCPGAGGEEYTSRLTNERCTAKGSCSAECRGNENQTKVGKLRDNRDNHFKHDASLQLKRVDTDEGWTKKSCNPTETLLSTNVKEVLESMTPFLKLQWPSCPYVKYFEDAKRTNKRTLMDLVRGSALKDGRIRLRRNTTSGMKSFVNYAAYFNNCKIQKCIVVSRGRRSAKEIVTAAFAYTGGLNTGLQFFCGVILLGMFRMCRTSKQPKSDASRGRAGMKRLAAGGAAGAAIAGAAVVAERQMSNLGAA